MKETYYFPHDYNAQDDPKIVRLLRAYGWDGYGIYWAIIERLYNQDGRLPEDYDDLAYTLRVDSKLAKAIVNDFKLFFLDSGKIGSKSVDRRLQERRCRSEAARMAGLASAEARGQRPLNERLTSVSTAFNYKIKESKEKKTKEKYHE